MRPLDAFWIAVALIWGGHAMWVCFRHRALMRMIRDRDRPAWDYLCNESVARFPVWTRASLKLLLRDEPTFADPILAAAAQRFRAHYRVYLISGFVLVALFIYTELVHKRTKASNHAMQQNSPRSDA